MADNIYCPRCGNKFLIGSLFCRSCGLALDGVSEIVTGDIASAPVLTSRPNFKAIRLGLGIFILGLVIGLINGALRDFGLYPESYGKMVFLVFIAVGMLRMGSGIVFPVKKYTKRKPSKQMSEGDTTVGLETPQLAGQLSLAVPSAITVDLSVDNRELITVDRVSVTEHTTRNLDV